MSGSSSSICWRFTPSFHAASIACAACCVCWAGPSGTGTTRLTLWGGAPSLWRWRTLCPPWVACASPEPRVDQEAHLLSAASARTHSLAPRLAISRHGRGQPARCCIMPVTGSCSRPSSRCLGDGWPRGVASGHTRHGELACWSSRRVWWRVDGESGRPGTARAARSGPSSNAIYTQGSISILFALVCKRSLASSKRAHLLSASLNARSPDTAPADPLHPTAPPHLPSARAPWCCRCLRFFLRAFLSM
jgi:hypothetical protein